MTISDAIMVKKFHERFAANIEKFNLQHSKLLEQLDTINIAPLPKEAHKETTRQSLAYFFEVLDCLPDKSVKVLRESGIYFLLKDVEAWVELEYLIHASNTPKKAVGLRRALANIINNSNGIYITSDIVTTEMIVGNEYQLLLHSNYVFNYGIWGTELFRDLRRLTSSACRNNNSSTTLSNSIKGFFDIFKILSKVQIYELKKTGLQQLISKKNKWIEIEHLIYNARDKKSALLLIKQLTNLVNYSNGIYKQTNLVTTTIHERLETPVLYNAYQVSIDFFHALVNWKENKIKDNEKENTIRIGLSSTLKAVEYITKNKKYKNDFAEKKLLLFNKNIELSEDLKENIHNYNHVTMIEILESLGIDYPNYRVLIKKKGGAVFLRNTYKYSTVIFKELVDLAQNNTFESLRESTATHYFSDFDSIGLPLLKELLSEDEFIELSKTGLSYLDSEHIKDIVSEYARGKGFKTTYKLGFSILKAFFKKDIFHVKESPYTLYFSRISRNNEITALNMDVLGKLSDKAFNDFKIKHDEYIKNIYYADESEITYHSRLQNFIAGLKKVLPTLSEKQIKAIKDNGLAAFIDIKYNIGISCLEEFQSLVKRKKEKSVTINQYRQSFRAVIGDFVGEIPDVYFISTAKDKQLKKLSNNSDTYYTTEEVRELAFYIEKGLISNKISLHDKIYLYYAKVQIKTGWNQQPLLDLSLDRLSNRINPVTKKENYELVLVKNRRGYKPSLYDFDRNSVSERDLRSAINDIFFIRDNLTANLRAIRKLDNYLFIEPCEVNGVKRIEPRRLRRIPGLITSLGCEVHYNPRKVRKGGVNYIYKNIAKSVREYENLAAHNFQTFLKSYKSISKSETDETLSKGIDIMANYFSGKEINQELSAIDDISELDNVQETPTGICSSEPYSDEVQRYNKLNVKLVDEDNKFCGDFLACIWCKYFKVVKDADHTWKLLSYKEYVISSMERATVKNEDFNSQKEFINILSRRVDDIIYLIEKTKPDAVKKARLLIESKGIHPDWEFAFPQINIGR